MENEGINCGIPPVESELKAVLISRLGSGEGRNMGEKRICDRPEVDRKGKHAHWNGMLSWLYRRRWTGSELMFRVISALRSTWKQNLSVYFL